MIFMVVGAKIADFTFKFIVLDVLLNDASVNVLFTVVVPSDKVYVNFILFTLPVFDTGL